MNRSHPVGGLSSSDSSLATVKLQVSFAKEPYERDDILQIGYCGFAEDTYRTFSLSHSLSLSFALSLSVPTRNRGTTARRQQRFRGQTT